MPRKSIWEAEYKTYKLLQPLHDAIKLLEPYVDSQLLNEEFEENINSLYDVFGDLDTRLDQLDEVHSYKPPEYLVTEVEDLLAT